MGKVLFKIFIEMIVVENYQVDLCSKYDREHDFDVIVSRTLWRAEVDMSWA